MSCHSFEWPWDGPEKTAGEAGIPTTPPFESHQIGFDEIRCCLQLGYPGVLHNPPLQTLVLMNMGGVGGHLKEHVDIGVEEFSSTHATFAGMGSTEFS